MGQTDIEEGILDHRLHHGKCKDHAAGTALRQQKTAAQQASDQDGQDARQCKTHAGEEDLTHRVALSNGKELIAELDARRGAAPEQIGRDRGGQDAGDGGKKIGFRCVGLHAVSPISFIVCLVFKTSVPKLSSGRFRLGVQGYSCAKDTSSAPAFARASLSRLLIFC